MDNNALLTSVKNGQWLRAQRPVKKQQRPDVFRPIPLGVNTPTTTATKTEDGWYERAVRWWT
eukprot:3938889-Prymnesium_polylepis.2